MNPQALALVLLSVVTFSIGHLFLKVAMGRQAARPPSADDPAANAAKSPHAVWLPFAAGIVAMGISFLVDLGLLQRFELSYVYPFHALSLIFITLAAAVFLRERITFSIVLSLIFVLSGLALVFGS